MSLGILARTGIFDFLLPRPPGQTLEAEAADSSTPPGRLAELAARPPAGTPGGPAWSAWRAACQNPATPPQALAAVADLGCSEVAYNPGTPRDAVARAAARGEPWVLYALSCDGDIVAALVAAIGARDDAEARVALMDAGYHPAATEETLAELASAPRPGWVTLPARQRLAWPEVVRWACWQQRYGLPTIPPGMDVPDV